MARYEEDINKRRAKREAMRKKQQAEQRRLLMGLIAAAVVLVLCGVGIFLLARQNGSAPEEEKTTQKPQSSQPIQPTQAAAQQQNTLTTIHIKAAGDLNITNSVVDAGLSGTGYDYTKAFMDVASTLADADLTVLNFEGNICGEPYGTETTSAPREILTALRNAGVDMLQMANSCSINNGLIGLNSTLTAIREAGLVPLGAYATPADFRESGGYTVVDVQGIRVAFVAFTKGVGGMGMPSGNEDCVNLLYTDYATTYDEIDRDGITAILNNVAAEKPDITIAMLHWGSEYSDVVSSSQESIVSLMKKNGVDVILGTHPHTVQEVAFDKAAGTLVAYSLGDFFGNATKGGTNYSIILDIEITKDAASGATRVTDFSYTPIYTLKKTDSVDGRMRVVRITEAQFAYSGNYVDKITESCNSDMTYSLSRIEVRVDPSKATEPTEATE
ncbi:MAG: CapA family protein [Oscillospiraceae bacterium]|nr:CapA family protein [Oscillospiraceae bacterium]